MNLVAKPQPSEEQRSKAKAKMTRRQLGRLHELLEKYTANLEARKSYVAVYRLSDAMEELQQDIAEHDQGSDEVKARILQR